MHVHARERIIAAVLALLHLPLNGREQAVDNAHLHCPLAEQPAICCSQSAHKCVDVLAHAATFWRPHNLLRMQMCRACLLCTSAQISKVCGCGCGAGNFVAQHVMEKVFLLIHKRAACALAAPNKIQRAQARRLRALANHPLAVGECSR